MSWLLRGVSAKAQVSFPISYKGKYLGEYAADLVVGEKVIVELKCVDRFANEHLAQCINYLKASRLSVALPEAQGDLEVAAAVRGTSVSGERSPGDPWRVKRRRLQRLS